MVPIRRAQLAGKRTPAYMYSQPLAAPTPVSPAGNSLLAPTVDYPPCLPLDSHAVRLPGAGILAANHAGFLRCRHRRDVGRLWPTRVDGQANSLHMAPLRLLSIRWDVSLSGHWGGDRGGGDGGWGGYQPDAAALVYLEGRRPAGLPRQAQPDLHLLFRDCALCSHATLVCGCYREPTHRVCDVASVQAASLRIELPLTRLITAELLRVQAERVWGLGAYLRVPVRVREFWRDLLGLRAVERLPQIQDEAKQRCQATLMLQCEGNGGQQAVRSIARCL